MGFLEQIFGAELGLPARFVLAFVLILALIGLAVWVFRYFGMGTMVRVGTARGRPPRLSVLEATPVDARRRLILIRRDNVEHLMLVGGPTDVVVESNIVGATPLMTATAPEPAPRTIGRPARLTAEPETETPLVPAATPQPIAPRSEGMTAAQPRPELKPEPKGPSRAESQYADMAHRLEAALRRPIEQPGAPRPVPTAPAHPSAAAPRVEPKIDAAPERSESKVEARTEQPAPPRVEPRAAPAGPATPPVAPAPMHPAPAPTPPAAARPPTAPTAAPQPASQAAPKRDVFANLEEEMANLLGRSGKSN